ncbi:hypothetical protein KXS11_00300 [Plantibacter flavus]|uniref:hypothetical protein n=1 Tax=Plantibacter flavus TaxID=150123 RepID=UPI003F14AA28
MGNDSHPKLDALVNTTWPTMKAERPTEAERAQFVYDLLREVLDYVKYDLHGPDSDNPERDRLGRAVRM